MNLNFATIVHALVIQVSAETFFFFFSRVSLTSISEGRRALLPNSNCSGKTSRWNAVIRLPESLETRKPSDSQGD